MSKEHWAELGDGRRARIFRAALLNRVLSHFGLSVAAGPAATSSATRKGGTAVVSDLGALWVEAERLAGRRLDPLEPGLVAALSS